MTTHCFVGQVAARLRASCQGLVLATLLSAAAVHGVRAQVPADPYDVTRSVRYAYDDRGLLVDEIVEPGIPDVCLRKRYTYDGVGNLKAVRESPCAGASADVSRDVERTRTVEWAAQTGFTLTLATGPVTVDTPAGMFASTSHNALGQVRTARHDPRFGGEVEAIEPDGLRTVSNFDEFGRLVLQRFPDGTSARIRHCLLPADALDRSANSAGCPGSRPGEAPPDAVAFVQTDRLAADGQVMAPFVRTYHDALGRVVRTARPAFDLPDQPAATRASLVVIDTVYGRWGARELETAAWFLDSRGTLPDGTRGIGVSRFDVDALGRVRSVYRADAAGVDATPVVFGGAAADGFGSYGAARASRTTTEYRGLSTVVINDLGQRREEERRPGGEIVRITDALGGQVVYRRDPFGSLLGIVDALQNRTRFTVDVRGHRLEMEEPNSGLWRYRYDVLGRLIRQESPRHRAAGTASTMAYDVLDRRISRSDPEYTSNWSFDRYADGSACTLGTGRLCETWTSHGWSSRLGYDSLGRLATRRTSIVGGPSAGESFAYDGNTGRVTGRTWPSGLRLGQRYTPLGHLQTVRLETATTIAPWPDVPGATAPASSTQPGGATLWQATALDATGGVATATLGNGLTARTTRDASTFRPARIAVGAANAADVLDHRYRWDSAGNLRGRTDVNGDGATGAVTEEFGYDPLNRLERHVVAGVGIPGLVQTSDFRYDALGNLVYRSGVGYYAYGPSGAARAGEAPGPHAVAWLWGGDAGTRRFEYDLNGNVVRATGAAYDRVSYTSFDLPDGTDGLSGAGGTIRHVWQYGPSHERVRETRRTRAGVRDTWSMHPDGAGSLLFDYEVFTPFGSGAATVAQRHFIRLDPMTTVVVATDATLPALASSAGGPSAAASLTLRMLDYWHYDHLGSVASTSDHVGRLRTHTAYDVFGKRRFTDGRADPLNQLILDWTPGGALGTARGFTGHEHLDDVGLIHMNGRLFDPLIARFLQVDPEVADTSTLQGFNRYAYVMNNPLNATDPTGRNGNLLMPGDHGSAAKRWMDRAPWHDRWVSEDGGSRDARAGAAGSAGAQPLDAQSAGSAQGSGPDAGAAVRGFAPGDGRAVYARESVAIERQLEQVVSRNVDSAASSKAQVEALAELKSQHEALVTRTGSPREATHLQFRLSSALAVAAAREGRLDGASLVAATTAGAVGSGLVSSDSGGTAGRGGGNAGAVAKLPRTSIARIVPGSLPAAEEAAALNTLRHIDSGTKPSGDLGKKWGTQFKNWAGDLPGAQGPASPYLEYRVAPTAGTTGSGTNRIVVNGSTGEVYYTWTHYGDTAKPAFVQIR